MFLFRTEELPNELVAGSSFRDLIRGETLYRQGDAAESVFICTQGRLQLCTSTSDGKHVPLYIVRAGECVAEAALFADYYCSDVIAEVKSRVRAFPQKALQNALHKRPDLAAEFMAQQAKRCSSLRISLELRSLRSARQRILQYIRIFALKDSQVLRLDRTLKNVADDLGLTHETFYRTLAVLIEEGIIGRTGNTLSLRKSFRPVQHQNSTALPV